MDKMTIEEFKMLPMLTQLNMVNGVRGKTDQFSDITGCEFSYKTATNILLEHGCVSVGSCMWQPPMFTHEEKDQLMTFVKKHATAGNAAEKSEVVLTPIKTSTHTSVRLSAETKEAWDRFCSERGLISPAVLMDTALKYFMEAIEAGTLNLKA